MGSLVGSMRSCVFGISSEEVTFARRGFGECDTAVREHLEGLGRAFVEGYNAALYAGATELLAERLGAIESSLRGFAFEGAAMGLALLDLITPWNKKRVRTFLEGPGRTHIYMVYVGVGWAVARLGRSPRRCLDRLDPLLGWLAIDGYGFHEGFFHRDRCVRTQGVPRRLSGYAVRAFDQGLGRSLWFSEGANAARLARTVMSFSSPRRADLWSGIGLASAYAGGGELGMMESLRAAAGTHYPSVALGAAFAAKVRERADNQVPHTELACQVLCGMSADNAARVTDRVLEGISDPDMDLDSTPVYEVWRQGIQRCFAQETVIS